MCYSLNFIEEQILEIAAQDFYCWPQDLFYLPQRQNFDFYCILDQTSWAFLKPEEENRALELPDPFKNLNC